MLRRHWVLGLICASIVITCRGVSGADNSGELFPDVKPYDDQVPSPVNKPEKSIDKSKVGPASATPPPEPVITRPPNAVPPPPPPPPPAPVHTTVPWIPYGQSLLAPLLSPQSQARFDKEFAPWIDSILTVRGSEITSAAKTLWKFGDAEGMPVDLKTVLWLHALGLSLRDTSQTDDRATRAMAVLPLLKDETLAVAQARTDAVTGLAFSALSKASEDLLGMALESECKLARMQVQSGFADEAESNRKVAHDIIGYLKQKTDAQKNLLAETDAWVDRAQAAHASAPEWEKTLAANPNDPKVNTQMAILSLSLFGDLEKASRYAAKSDQKELKDLAQCVAVLQRKSKDLSLKAADSFNLARALLAVAEIPRAPHFDQFSIALFAQEKIAPFADPAHNPPAVSQIAANLQSKAAEVIAGSGLKPPAFAALAALQAAADSKAGPGAAKLQLFVKDNGIVVKYVKPTATENAEALKLIRAFAKDMSDKISIKFTEIETDHCLIITNWDPNQQAFLKKNVEGAYLAVAKMFDFPANENVFPGKLPVFMLKKSEDFRAFIKVEYGVDYLQYSGIFNTTKAGIGYIATYQPTDKSGQTDLLAAWGRGLTWDMGYAFEAHYRTNKELPVWLKNGLAAHVGNTAFPDPAFRRAIVDWVEFDQSIAPLFGKVGVNFDVQAVMASIVEMLMSKDKKAFIELVNKIKDGESQDDALKETFHCTTDDIAKAWKPWITRTLGGNN